MEPATVSEKRRDISETQKDVAVTFENIHQAFGDTVALGSINLEIGRGEFVVLLGPSGSGKTTLLNLLGGFTTPTSGRVLIDSKDETHTPPAKRPTTTVFQDYALFPHMSVARNVGFGLDMRKVKRREQGERIERALEMVGLGGKGKRGIHELSGGQRQRVALARSLVVDPSVLPLDEPLGALDLNLRRQMQLELKEIQERVGTTFVHVTHDQDEAMSIADTIVVMDHGVIEDIGEPERIYLRPASTFAATFMGESNLLEGHVQSVQGGSCTVETSLGTLQVRDDVSQAEAGQKIHISIRPEQLLLNANGLSLGEGVLESQSFLGTHYACTLRHSVTGDILKARLPQGSSFVEGEHVALSVATEDAVLLTR